MKQQRIAVFDFDGTITHRDSFVEFLRFACGWRIFLACFAVFAPLLVLMKLRLYSNEKAKERVLSFCFKGMDYDVFKSLGCRFAEKIEGFKRNEVVDIVRQHLGSGDKVYVVTASVEEWVVPWCQQNGINHVVCTRMEVDNNGKLTGKLSTPNCYGSEKVRRFLEVEPLRAGYLLFAYGDSRGDKEMIEYADFGKYVN